VLALATDLPVLVLAGFLVVGLALAGVAPIAFSLAGDAAPRRAGAASAVITTIGYGGFLLGPGLVGGLAEVSSLRLALLVVAAAGIAISALTIALRRRGA
jgi:MFS family permease